MDSTVAESLGRRTENTVVSPLQQCSQYSAVNSRTVKGWDDPMLTSRPVGVFECLERLALGITDP